MTFPRAGGLVVAVALSLSVACGCGSSGAGQNSYFPVGVGSTWAYAVTPPAGSGYTQTMSITQASGTSVTRKVLTSGAATYQLQTYDVSSGVVETAAATYNVSDDSLVSGTSLTWSPPALILPSNTSAGATASSTSTVSGGPTAYSVTRAVTMNGTESVTVPAGTFSALKVTTLVTSTLTPSAPGTYNVRWHAPGVGTVQIVNYPATSPASTTTFALTSYTLPAGGSDGGPPPPTGGTTVLTGGSFSGIAVDGANNVWVADSVRNTVTKLSSAGTVAGTYSVGTGPGALAIDASGQVWVANGGTTNQDSVNVTELNSSGQAIGGFKVITGPQNIAISAGGQVWVLNGTVVCGPNLCDAVSVLGPSGANLATYNVGTPYTYGMAIDASGNAWFAHTDNTVTKLSSAGATLGTYGVGQKANQTAVGPGLAIDASGSVWVANPADDTVTKLGPTGAKQGVYAVGHTPTNIAVDTAGHVWVLNAGDSIVTELSAAGTTLGTLQTGNNNNMGIAIDRTGNVWVSGTHLMRFSAVATGPQYFPYSGPQFP